MNNEEIMVSICCITFNHEKFIKEALDSFLMQKTNFNYEIVIHDDASTDKTAEIIKEYEKKYPDIIKPIYQIENQYSKGKKASLISYSHAKGKYIAICEGDDYWIDENKLQKQVDYMEKHNNCTLCFHDAYIFNMKTQKRKKWNLDNKKFLKRDGDYNAGELDLLGFIPTASFMFRKEYVKHLPDWFEKCVVGDRPLREIMASFGYAHYIDDKMSVYRVQSGNSAIDNIAKRNKDEKKAIEFWQKMEWFLEQFNDFSNYQYQEQLKLSKNQLEKNILLAKQDYKTIIKTKKYRMWLSNKGKIKIFLEAYFPKIYKIGKGIIDNHGKK